MSQLLIHNAEMHTHGKIVRSGWLLIDNGRIAQMGEGTAPTIENAQLIDAQGQTALPGFIDVHVHGALGHDTMDATPEALTAMAQFYAKHGVTAFLPTTMTTSRDHINRALENAARCVGPIERGASIIGVHLEGPYINYMMKGAQPGEHVRLADSAEYEHWLDLNVIKQVTVAPEFAENQAFIRECVKRSINVSIGHTQATYDDVVDAVEHGARQSTHTYNAMIGLHHRNPGTVGGVLSIDEMRCELIPDNVHVHPASMKVAVRAKGAGGIVLITDAMMGAGMPEGQYDLGGQPVTVHGNRATLADGTLAGSILTFDIGFRNVLAAANLTIDQGWPMSSANAAAQLGIADHKGKLAVGYDADVILLDTSSCVTLTVAMGKIVYSA